MAVPLDWSVRISDMEALLVARQTELGQQQKAKRALETSVETERKQQKGALLRVLQLRSKHADASLKLAQMRNTLTESGSVSTSAAETCRLEERCSRLQAQVQAMQGVQQRERQTMREFSALAEKHLSAAAAPLRDAQQALAQAHRRLQESKQLAQAQPALQAEITQLDAAAEALVQQQQAAGHTLEKVQIQAENRALQKMIDDQRAVNNSRAQANHQAATAQAAKAQAVSRRLDKLQQESRRLAREEEDLEHKLAECRAVLLKLSAVS